MENQIIFHAEASLAFVGKAKGKEENLYYSFPVNSLNLPLPEFGLSSELSLGCASLTALATKRWIAFLWGNFISIWWLPVG